MNQVITEIDVDVQKQNVFVEVRAKQGDTMSRYIHAKIFSNKQQLIVDQAAKVYLNVEKSDKTHVLTEGKVNEDGTITVELSKQALAIDGIINCDISIESEGGKLTTQLFKVNVERSAIDDEAIESSDEYPILTELLLKVEKVDENETLRQENEELRQQLYTEMQEYVKDFKESGMPIATSEKVGGIKGSDDINIAADGTATISKEKLVNMVYPVGSIYLSISPTDPKTLFGGTWVRFANGRTLVGVDTLQTEFNTVEKTGGSKTHKLTVNEMPAHNHAMIDSAGNKEFGTTINQESTASRLIYAKSYSVVSSPDKMQKSGGDQAHNNLQPYITVYMWKRTA